MQSSHADEVRTHAALPLWLRLRMPPSRCLQLLRFGLRERVGVFRTYFASHAHFTQELCTMANPAWQVGARGGGIRARQEVRAAERKPSAGRDQQTLTAFNIW